MILYCRLDFVTCTAVVCWNAEPMGFNLAVWDNHVGNNQHSFQRLFIIVHYLCCNLTLQKMVSTCVQSQWNSGENSLFFYPWRFTLKFPLHHLNWIWWIEKLWTIFHLYEARFSLILSQLDDDVASLSPVYAFNSKLKIIHHSSIVDFIIDLLLNESQSERNENADNQAWNGEN